MTVFGWDASHYDGRLTPSILARAAGEGIAFFTHKIAEGLLDTEGGGDDTALAAARTAGIPAIGGYLVPRSNASPTAQVDAWIKLADAGEPWWRTFPGWFWQIDLERWPYDAVPASVGIAAAQQLRARTGRWTILYASRSQYGNQLAGWDGPLWNADYVSSGAYPGDGWAPGWAPYSGKTPTILQYTSSATIGGLTTSDRNAFRGTLDQLLTLIGGNDVSVHTDAVIAAWESGLTTASDGTFVAPVDWEIRHEKFEAGAAASLANLAAAIADVKAAVSAPPAVDVQTLAPALASAGIGQVDVDKLAAALAQHLPSHIQLTGTVSA
jgi:hypothetical protein